MIGLTAFPRSSTAYEAVVLILRLTVLDCQVPTASKAKAALQPGMTESQVVSLRGKPDAVRHPGAGAVRPSSIVRSE